MPDDLIQILECLNRKERFFLVGTALGNRKFHLSECFRLKLQCAIKLDEPIPESAFVAMDYHLDWVAAALEKYSSLENKEAFKNRQGESRRLVEGNQEDVDFFVAFRGKNSAVHLIFLEAKAYSRWDYKQLRSKAERLKLIFGSSGDRQKGVNPHFCVVAKTPPDAARLSARPDWWIRPGTDEFNSLNFKLPKTRLKVSRWDTSTRKSSRNGEHFRITQA